MPPREVLILLIRCAHHTPPPELQDGGLTPGYCWDKCKCYFFKFNNVENRDRRRPFLKHLALDLMREHLEERALIQSLPKDIQIFLENYKKIDSPVRDDVKPGICYICGKHKNNRTKSVCQRCGMNVCKKHSTVKIQCFSCNDEQMEIY
ncbi:hypothetical protein NQ318_020388 [Aromia moschata]|uniref:PiggyBac transposable element-derived protein 4 C-terminal zinc-ribbon domain-containing protein n=1 Tax=Aromia moschata TaxID=1265417 RepID=A0AAV8Y3T1_9CUCU|nr:hypothetical protein NQ318_020388 [Aromia moschata]